MNIDLKDKTVRLSNGRFVDVENGCYFNKKVSLIIKNDKIIGLPGINENKDIAADYEIDLGGRYVHPGLINTHTHIQLSAPSLLYTMRSLKLEKKYHQTQTEKRMRDCLDYGVTIIRDAGTSYHPLSANRELKANIEKGKLPGPRILQSVIVNIKGNYQAESLGSFLDFLSRLFGKSLSFSNPESSVMAFNPKAGETRIRELVNAAIDVRGIDYIKLAEQKYNRLKPGIELPLMSRDQMAWIVDQAHQRGKKTTFHHLEADSFRHALDAGVFSIAHMPFDAALDDTDIARFMKAGSFIEPSLSGITIPGIWELPELAEMNNENIQKILKYKQSRILEIAERFWIPELQDEIMTGLRKIRQGKLKTSLINARPLFRQFLLGAGKLISNTGKLIEAGALSRMSIASDGGIITSDADTATELDLINLCMETTGKSLSGADAIQIATLNGARVLGLEDDYATITPGKIADLAVIDKDPLEDYRNIGRPVCALFKNGRMVINRCGLQIRSRIRLVSRSKAEKAKPAPAGPSAP